MKDEIIGLARRTRLVAAVCAMLLLFAFTWWAVAKKSGQAGDSTVTVAVPDAVSDRIWGAPQARGRPIVVIDPGHGGSDPGAKSASGAIAEKDLTLTLARELRDRLVERGRVRVAMTRDDDRYIGLDERPAVARRLDAALFVSLHMDSAPNPSARGASVYSLSDVASDGEAARLATVQNGAGGANAAKRDAVGAILADLALRSEMTASADLAVRLVGKASGRVAMRPQPHRFASFYVLRRADSPAVLFEAGYLSNAEDEALLRSPDYRAKVVDALADTIETAIAARLAR